MHKLLLLLDLKCSRYCTNFVFSINVLVVAFYLHERCVQDLFPNLNNNFDEWNLIPLLVNGLL